MKTLTFFLALSLCAAAQTSSNVSGLTLTGDLNDPVVENHSGKTVLWALWSHTTAGSVGGPSVGSIWFMDPASGTSGLSDGASAKALHRPVKSKVISAAITEAIFADGEFRGDEKGPMRHDVETEFRFMREEWQWAQVGEWDKLQARADEVDIGILPIIVAKKLLQARGDSVAMAALAYYGLLPASTWTAGLLNRLRAVPNVFQAIAC